MVKSVDTKDLKSFDRKVVRVQVSFWGLQILLQLFIIQIDKNLNMLFMYPFMYLFMLKIFQELLLFEI